DACELERAVVAEHARALLADARVEELGVDAVGVHVGEARGRIEVAGADRVVGEPGRPELEPALARGRHETDGAPAIAAVEEPHVGVAVAYDPRRALAEARRHALLPHARRLVDVRVGVDDRVVDARDVVEDVDRLAGRAHPGTRSTYVAP